MRYPNPSFFFFFNDTATTEIYTLSLHDALPIYLMDSRIQVARACELRVLGRLTIHKRLETVESVRDRKSTRLNSSHLVISYAVFCLKKKNETSPACRPRLVRR